MALAAVVLLFVFTIIVAWKIIFTDFTLDAGH
jgi:hypothetical protein